MEGLQKLSRQHNDILNLFRFYKGIDRSEISRNLQLSMPTIYSAVDALSANNILSKTGSTVELNPDYGTLIGISIGSSLCKVSFIDFNYDIFSTKKFENHKLAICKKIEKIIEDKGLLQQCMRDDQRNYVYFKTPTSFSLLKDILNCVFEHIQDCVMKNILNVLCIGISCTGIINDKTQTILNSHNLNYLNNATLDTLIAPSKQMFFNENQIYVCLTQNSNASVIAEKINLYKTNSIYKSKENIVSLYLGAGLGAGLYLGQLYAGSHGYAGEFSHNHALSLESDELLLRRQELIEKNIVDAVCTCGNADCYDYKIRTYVFEKTMAKFCDSSSDDIKTYLSKNPEKAKLLSTYLGNIINNISSFLNIDLIIFTGKFYKSMELLMNYIDIIQDQNPMRFSRNDCKIVISTLGPLSPSIGAAIYAYHQKHDLPLSWDY